MVLHKERYSNYRRGALGLCRNDWKKEKTLEMEGRVSFLEVSLRALKIWKENEDQMEIFTFSYSSANERVRMCGILLGNSAPCLLGSLVTVKSLESDIFGRAKFLTAYLIGVQLVHGQLLSFDQDNPE